MQYAWKKPRICAFPKCAKEFTPLRKAQDYCTARCRRDDWDRKNPRRREKSRSLRADVRNPLFALESARKLRTLSKASRKVLDGILEELSTDARKRAEESWKRHKAPMAVYWKAVAVYAGHARRLLR